jgi:hypothetical protein
MSRRPRRMLLLLAVAQSAACGDLMFSSDPSQTGVETLGIAALRVEWRQFRDTLRVNDSAVAEIRIRNQAGEDVTSLVDQVEWSVSPTTVAALSQGITLGSTERIVRALSQGQATVAVSASFTRPNGDQVRSQPASRLMIVAP